jgi:adenylate cyclase
MNEPLTRDALRRIQDIVIEAKGSPLGHEAARRVEAILRSMSGGPADPEPGFSEREATILFADLRGFSAIAAAYPAEVLLPVLSQSFGLMTEIVVRHYGTTDKFTGDGIMAVFYGEQLASRDHAVRALLCAVEIQIAMNGLREVQHEARLPELYVGIGINSGRVMSGLIGSDAFRAYTVIGEEVNLAARIEAFSLRGQVLMSEATYQHCREFVQAGELMEVHVKGRADSVRIRELLAIPEFGKVVPRQDQRKCQRVAVALPFEYRTLSGKMVDGKRSEGVIRDISYQGALIEVGEALELYAELRLAFRIPALDYRARDLYARVVSARERDGRHQMGLEFTSLSTEASGKIHLFVEMRIQGEVTPSGELKEPRS